MGALVGDLSADVAQCGYFGTKNGHVLFMGANARQAAELKKLKKSKKTVLSFSVNATKRPTGVRKKRKTRRGEGATLSYFWRPPLGVS